MGMELTTFGRSLLPHAVLLESELGRALEEIDLLKGASKGSARIGVLPSLAPDYLPKVLNRVLSKSPGIQIQVLEAPNHQLIFALIRGEIDFAVATASPELIEENVHVTTLVEDEICVVARGTHPIIGNPTPTEKDLCQYKWVMQEKGGAIWRDFRSLFTNVNLEPPTITLSANSIQTLKSIVLSGDFLTMLPRIAIKTEERNGALRSLPIPAALWRRQLAILRRVKGPLLPAAGLVLAEFRKAMAKTGKRSAPL
jgi:DNA-binding transcriptional LysR family regulator